VIRYQSFNNFSDLADAVRAAVQRDRDLIVSCDVFDTLLHRRAKPDAIIAAVGRELCIRLRAQGRVPCVDVLAARATVFHELADRAVASGRDHDLCIADAVLPWVRRVSGAPFEGDDAVAAAILAHEIALETSATYPNEAMIRLLRDLKDSGTRVVLASDMYLGAEAIEAILAHHGISDLYERIFVSCDVGVLKRTGRMFAFLPQVLNGSPSRILHVGDNRHSDGAMAAKAGLTAFVVRSRAMERRYAALAYDLGRQKRDAAWKGMCAAAYAQRAMGEVGTVGQAFGLRIVGPILVPLVHAFAERCRDQGVSRLVFALSAHRALGDIFRVVAPLVFAEGTVPEIECPDDDSETAPVSDREGEIDLVGLAAILSGRTGGANRRQDGVAAGASSDGAGLLAAIRLVSPQKEGEGQAQVLQGVLSFARHYVRANALYQFKAQETLPYARTCAAYAARRLGSVGHRYWTDPVEMGAATRPLTFRETGLPWGRVAGVAMSGMIARQFGAYRLTAIRRGATRVLRGVARAAVRRWRERKNPD